MTEARQALDPVLLIELVPGPDRIVVEKQHLRYRFATHAIVQQHQRIRPPRQPVCSRPVTRQLDQVAARFAVQEPRADHAASRIASCPVGKRFFRNSVESGYTWRPWPALLA